jgi:hypothetical protein
MESSITFHHNHEQLPLPWPVRMDMEICRPRSTSRPLDYTPSKTVITELRNANNEPPLNAGEIEMTGGLDSAGGFNRVVKESLTGRLDSSVMYCERKVYIHSHERGKNLG